MRQPYAQRHLGPPVELLRVGLSHTIAYFDQMLGQELTRIRKRKKVARPEGGRAASTAIAEAPGLAQGIQEISDVRQ